MMDVKVKIYDGIKYFKCKKVKEILYRNIIGFEVVKGERAEQIGSEIDASSIDPYNEYLVIYLENASTATFGYSKSDLFINHRKDVWIWKNEMVELDLEMIDLLEIY